MKKYLLILVIVAVFSGGCMSANVDGETHATEKVY